jgi:hypothetical protein
VKRGAGSQLKRNNARRNCAGCVAVGGNTDYVDILLRLEDAALAVLAAFLFVATGLPWWWLIVLFLVPDLSIVAYVLGPCAGSVAYNVIHHRGLAVVVYLAGAILRAPLVSAAGAALLFHSSVDRVLGYGLKYSDSFRNTHLGRIGRKQGQPPD